MGNTKRVFELITNSITEVEQIANSDKMDKEEKIEFYRMVKHCFSDEFDVRILKLETNKVKSSLELLENELSDFDYFYEHSDDHSVWKFGCRNQKRIQEIINNLEPENLGRAQELVDEYFEQYGARFTVPTEEELENEMLKM